MGQAYLAGRETPEELAGRLAVYQIISFDIFDTLIRRTYEKPVDLFSDLGQRFRIPGLGLIRKELEEEARQERFRTDGGHEVTLNDIWSLIALKTGIPAEEGMKAEMALEKLCCRANPYMQQVLSLLCGRKGEDRKIILTSDMYLPGDFLLGLLSELGFPEFDALYLSCELGCSKSDGRLYRLIKRKYGEEKRFVHIGDNFASDVRQSVSNGFAGFYYRSRKEPRNGTVPSVCEKAADRISSVWMNGWIRLYGFLRN